ncbi:hypothetical protein INT44_009188 [Umbelopsis vinacea]|uniref:RRM domain-containing protein n=1 Tax=Umbelopsis vinacea TaxID=44442 RepID=A0A8H7Q1G9_9FUNG|nr:hypothetical protein INT44_009188 [Umbelopsis vinacea]
MHASRYDALNHLKKGVHKDKCKSASDINDVETASTVTGINFSNASLFSSFDRKPQYFLDLVQSSQELLSDTVSDCYDTLGGIQQQVNHNFSSSLFETQWDPMCSTCHVHQATFSLIPCRHYVCNLCYQIRFRPPVNDFDAVGGELLHTCDVCFKAVETLKSLSDSTDESDCNDKRSGEITPIGVHRSLADTTSYRRLSSSEKVSEHLSTSIKWPVIKISNVGLKIPWDVSVSQVTQFFKSIKFPPPQMHSHFVHIIIDRSTGKTVSNAYVEVLEPTEAQRAVTTCHRKPLKGRLVHVSHSNQDELLKSLFPCWTGNFVKGMAIPTETQSVSPKQDQTFITRQEINSLLTICRNYKIHFSRKCPERPFENIMSIVCKYPWYQPELVTALQRDHIYECLKLAIGKYIWYYQVNLDRIDYITIDPALVDRMVRTGVMCPTFTERQQYVILNSAVTSGQECPEDIKHLIVPDHDKNHDSCSERTFTDDAPSESDDEDTDLSIGSSKLSKKDTSSRKLPAPHTHKHDEVGGDDDDASSDLSAWYDALPKSILDILDNASSMRHVGLKEFHSSFSTRVDVQQPKGRVTSQLELIPVRKHPNESTSLRTKTQSDSRSAIEERIRLLCEQLQPLCKRKSNIM